MKKITTTCDGVGAIFDYEDFALFALLVSNRLAMARIAGHRNDIGLLERAYTRIHAFLDEIDGQDNQEGGGQ